MASTLTMIRALSILRERGRQLAGSLSGGEQQMLPRPCPDETGPAAYCWTEPSMGSRPS